MSLTIAAMSVCYYYYNSFLLRKLEDQKLMYVSNLTAYTHSIKSLLNSQKSVMTSAQLPANGDFFKCLNDPEFDCTVATEQNFVLMNEDGSVFNDTSSATAGIDGTGVACNSYPSLQCPFRYELKWSRECVSVGPCRTPDLYIRGQLFVGDFSSMKFNINPVNFTVQMKLR
jgi:hypothetical protein